jgi:hypothetical protein
LMIDCERRRENSLSIWLEVSTLPFLILHLRHI